jgi:tetraacyldisaccharide 4'-kinase
VSSIPWEPGEGEPPTWARPLLAIAEPAFRAGVRLRSAAYRAGLLRSVRVDRPVISVGNLAVGGVGKTPFVILLAKRLASRGVYVAILSRGYGGRASSRGEAFVVSRGRGERPERDAREAGDEPVLIARKTDAAVVVAAERARAAHLAVRELGADLLILDDGFQHFGLARDLDIVLLDAKRPFGSGRLLPLGPLREPKTALARAGLLVLNHGLEVERDPDQGLEPALAGAPRLDVAIEVTAIGDQPPSALRGRRVGVLAAIARPNRFIETIEAHGATIVDRELHRDHAPLEAGAIEAFVARAKSKGAEQIVTTEKDFVRIPQSVWPLVEPLAIEHRIVRGEEALEAALARAQGQG